jgi:hypothetical protein
MPNAPGPTAVSRPSSDRAAGRLLGRDTERFGVNPAVVLGQDRAEAAGPVGNGTVADLAARDRKLGSGHREAAGT